MVDEDGKLTGLNTGKCLLLVIVGWPNSVGMQCEWNGPKTVAAGGRWKRYQGLRSFSLRNSFS